jgi:hypothetical protein
MGENICEDISDKRLLSKTHKEFLKLNNKKTNNPLKKSKRSEQDTTLKKIYRW